MNPTSPKGARHERVRAVRSGGMPIAVAALTLFLATGATALTPLTPNGPASTSTLRDTSDCAGSPAQLGASASNAPVTGAGSTGQYAQNGLRAPTAATNRVHPSIGVAPAYGGGIPYAGAGAPAGSGRLGPGSVNSAAPVQSTDRTQRMLALEPRLQSAGAAAPKSSCLEGRGGAAR
jgi:hypothetical protein